MRYDTLAPCLAECLPDSSHAHHLEKHGTLTEHAGNGSSPKLVIFFHFAMTSSGDSFSLTGKPCPPACCQRVRAAHPPETSNREPVVSALSEGEEGQTCMKRPAKRQTFANEIANNRCDKVGLQSHQLVFNLNFSNV